MSGLTGHTGESKTSSSSKHLLCKARVGGAKLWQYPLTPLEGSNTLDTLSQHSNEDARLSPHSSSFVVNRPMCLFGVTLHPLSHYGLIEHIRWDVNTHTNIGTLTGNFSTYQNTGFRYQKQLWVPRRGGPLIIDWFKITSETYGFSVEVNDRPPVKDLLL